MFLKKEKEKKKMTKKEGLSWTVVEKYLSEKTDGSAAMALIETEKILGEVLLKLKYKGKDNDIRLLSAKGVINNFEELKTAREVVRKLKEERNAIISINEAKKALDIYFESIRFLTKSKKERVSIFERINRSFRKNTSSYRKIFQKIVITFFTFFLIVFLLDSTKIGNQAAEAIVNISHFLFSWILFTFLLLFGILIIIVSTFFYFEKKRQRKMSGSLEDENKPKIEIKD